jgi:hypothetical protein
MTMPRETNPRKKALDAISRKIALFMVGETFVDERPAQKLLEEAIAKLDAAARLLVESDLAAAKAKG